MINNTLLIYLYGSKIIIWQEIAMKNGPRYYLSRYVIIEKWFQRRRNHQLFTTASLETNTVTVFHVRSRTMAYSLGFHDDIVFLGYQRDHHSLHYL